MDDLIITEVRKIKTELEQESKNDFELILKKHQSLHEIYKTRIVEKDELDRKSKTPSLK
ncbi:hypothetical protein [Leptospira montravelensis]|uniref:hypothetical protein n=1 Tax=Leptospira montravelensis TaxID=2484961 RepID=UPI00142E7513|nr:hypothetical protein [Leptospira montravelensis]